MVQAISMYPRILHHKVQSLKIFLNKVAVCNGVPKDTLLGLLVLGVRNRRLASLERNLA